MDASPLAKLPPETRNEIFELAFTVHNPAPLLDPDLPLTQTCRQTRGECLQVYYVCNEFELDISGEHISLALTSLAIAPLVRKLAQLDQKLLRHIPQVHVIFEESTLRHERYYHARWAYIWRLKLVCDALATKGLRYKQVAWNVRVTARNYMPGSYMRLTEREALNRVRWMWEVMANA